MSNRSHRFVRPLVEGALCLSIFDLRRTGALAPGTARPWMFFDWWGEPCGSAALYCRRDTLCVTYIVGSRSQRDVINLVPQRCHLGGVRKWFRCPDCQRRCAVLYLDPPGFVCRRCAGLAYESQRASRLIRLLNKSARNVSA